jgi:hypothetical protein
MKMLFAEWLWRIAVVSAIGWAGWELHQLRIELQPQADDTTVADAAPDPLQDSIDELSDEVATLHEKLDAIMLAMMQLKR